jgi:hypothetical protein
MAQQKSYKNVYTILEKVKKGEIESHYKDKEGLFGKINFYKKPDLIKPHLHYLDESRLTSIMDTHFSNKEDIKETYTKFSKSAAFRKIPDDKKPNYEKFQTEVLDIYRNKFPKHLSKDIFKMFYNKIEKLDFEDRTDKNQTKFKFLEHSNNPVAKIMSENSQLKSAIFMKNIVGYYLMQLAMLKFQDEQAAKDLMDNLSGGGDEFNNDKADKAVQKMLESKQAKDMLDEAIKEAQQTCKSLDEAMDDEQQDQMFEACNEGGGSEASKLDGTFIENISKKIQSINLSLGSLKEKIKKLMDKSVSYFSAKETVQFENIFDANDTTGIEDYLFLHPKLRKIMAEDIMVKETKKIGKIDVYIDISGSMSSGCGISNSDGNYISKLDFCKSFVYKLKQMDMLNELYTFQNSVKHVKNDLVTIAMIQDTGGTDINKAVKKIIDNGVNAIVITDAEDHCEIYSDKAFFIGVKGSNFSHFSEETIKQYSNRDQVIVFDGTTISKVDERGYTKK